jgi:hypothetical protein
MDSIVLVLTFIFSAKNRRFHPLVDVIVEFICDVRAYHHSSDMLRWHLFHCSDPVLDLGLKARKNSSVS